MNETAFNDWWDTPYLPTNNPFTPETHKPWVGLTKEEAADCWSNEAVRTWHAIETKLKEKNNG